MHREYANPFPANLIIENDRILTENANKVYRYGQIKADSPKNISANERKILDFLEANNSISNHEARNLLNIADSTSKCLLTEMVKKDLLPPLVNEDGGNIF